MAAADIFDEIPNFRAAERRGGLTGGLPLHRLQLFLGGGRGLEFPLGLGRQHVLIKGVEQILRQLIGRQTHHLGKLLAFAGAHLAVQPDHTIGKGCQGIRIPCAQRHIQHEFFHGNRRLALQGAGLGLFGFGDAYGVHNDKMVLVLGGRRGDFLQVILAQNASATAFHLLKIVLAAHVPHENQALDGFDIGAGGDHIHGYRNAGVIIVAEVAQDLLRVIGSVGDFLTELVAFAKFLADDLNDVVGMAVGFGKNQRFGHFLTPWEKCGEQILPERANDHTDLAGIDNVPVQLGGNIVHILIQLLPALFTGKTVAALDELLHNMGAALRYLGFNEKDIFAHVDAVDDGLLPGVFTDHIFLEERKGTLVRCGSQAHEKGVEIVQHLLPDIIDGAMTFIDNDAVKKFGGIFGVVDDFFGCLTLRGGHLIERGFFGGLVQFFPFQNGVHPLNGAYAHLHILGNIGVFQAADAVNLRKRAVVIVGAVGQKFPLGLFAQTFGVYQEQHTVDFGIFQQTVHRCNGGKSLAGTGGHLHKSSGAVFGKRTLQILNGCDLTAAEPGSVKRWEMLHVVANGVIRFQQGAQTFRAMKTENGTGTVFLIGIVGKTGQFAGGLIGKPNGVSHFDPFEGAAGITAGLTFHGGDVLPFLVRFGLYDAHRGAVHKKRIVHWPGTGGKLPHRHTGSCHRIQLAHILQNPAGLRQPLVNGFPRFLLWGHHKHLRRAFYFALL